MLYSLKKETGHQRPKDKTKNKRTYKIIATSCPTTHILIWINHHPPTLSPNHSSEKYNGHRIPRKMRQSNKCGSVRNDEIFNLHLGSRVGSTVSIPCLLEDTSHINWFHPPKLLTRKKQRTQKWDSTPNKEENQQNPGLREVDLKPSPKRGSDKFNMLK